MNILFQTFFSKTYKDTEDEQKHFEAFEAIVKLIAEHNPKYAAGKVSYSLGINQFADQLKEEKDRMHGVRLPQEEFGSKIAV